LCFATAGFKNIHPEVKKLAIPGVLLEDIVRGVMGAGLYDASMPVSVAKTRR